MLQGLRLIFRPGLKRFVLVPLAVNILIFGGAIWAGAAWFGDLMQRLETSVPGWLQWLDWLLWPLFVVAMLVVVFFSFTLVANLIASPFNGLLAEKTEAMLTGRPLEQAGDYKALLRELPVTLLEEVRKLVYAVAWSLPFLLLAVLIPLIGPLLWFLFTAWMLAVEYADFPMGNHGLSFRAMRTALRRRLALSLGFGAAAAGLTAIPVVNFVAMPAAVAGATAMWVRELKTVAGADRG